MARRRKALTPQDHPLHGRLLQVLEVADGQGMVWRVRLYLDLVRVRSVIARALYATDGISRSAGGGLVVVARRLQDEEVPPGGQHGSNNTPG